MVDKKNVRVLALCCTYNRYSCLQRSLRCFLDQEYEGEATLLIYNSGEPLSLGPMDSLPKGRQIILINNQKDKYTNAPYIDVGSKFRDALHAAPLVDVVVHWDDDDIPLPNHLSEGVKGYIRAREDFRLAYKPHFSYFRHTGGVEKSHNVFEPSIFVSYNHLMEAGYAPLNVRYHQQWLDPLTETNKILVDKDGPSTWIYDWHPEMKIHHLSGAKDNRANFVSHQIHSVDTGEGASLTPAESNSKYYNQVYELHQ